jgi:transposase
MGKRVDLQGFYPDYLQIGDVYEDTPQELRIYARSKKQSARCPECGVESTRLHSRCLRKGIRDLPILDQGIRLTVELRKFLCSNKECETRIFVESMSEFVGIRGVWTRRCEAMIVSIAMNTNCESAAKICTLMKIPISGDTVIRMLLRNIEAKPYNGTSIGVDDWAIRKGHHYGTMICDTESHLPIALLPGRDGISLREWLHHNKQVKVVTRDRAGAYAKAIHDILPEAIQIADRFHLHHNLLDAVRESLKRILPEKVWITEQEGSFEETVKKTVGIDGENAE